MAEVELKAGVKIDLLNQAELDTSLQRYMPESPLRGVTGIWIPVLNKAGANPFTMGGDAGQPIQGPGQGYAWSVRRLIVTGMTRTANPDIIQILRGQGGAVLWELNGNSYGVTFGRGELVLRAGESLFYQSVGTFAATGTITAQGFAQEVPQELEGKFYI